MLMIVVMTVLVILSIILFANRNGEGEHLSGA